MTFKAAQITRLPRLLRRLAAVFATSAPPEPPRAIWTNPPYDRALGSPRYREHHRDVPIPAHLKPPARSR